MESRPTSRVFAFGRFWPPFIAPISEPCFASTSRKTCAPATMNFFGLDSLCLFYMPYRDLKLYWQTKVGGARPPSQNQVAGRAFDPTRKRDNVQTSRQRLDRHVQSRDVSSSRLSSACSNRTCRPAEMEVLVVDDGSTDDTALLSSASSVPARALSAQRQWRAGLGLQRGDSGDAWLKSCPFWTATIGGKREN
jgi:hypothetical protein